MLIDTHCHLDFAQFSPDRDEVIRRANEAGVGYFVNIGATLDSSAASCKLAAEYPQIFASVGVHPHDADSFNGKALDKIKELAAGEKVVAIGETGLDYYRNLSSQESQRRLFSGLIALAKQMDLPLVVHTRQAEKETLDILKAAMPLRAVVHCFSGDEKFLKECMSLGFLVSFTCNVTYKKAQGLREMVRLAPLDRLMLETDAPYLSPEGFRGKRNEPAQVKLLAEEISRIKNIGFGEVEQRTTENAKAFFKLR